MPLRFVLPLCALLTALTFSTAAFADPANPMSAELRTLSFQLTGGVVPKADPLASDPAFSALDDEGEPVDLFDFGTIAPAFAAASGGRRDFGLGFAGDTTARVQALNFGRLTVGTTTSRREATFSERIGFGPNSFEETAAVEDGVRLFTNFDLVNDRTKRLGFDISLAQRRVGATAFSPEETASEVGASFSADVRLSSRLAFTGRAGVQISDDAHGHLDATRNKATLRSLSFTETQGGLKDAYVQGGLSFSLSENFSVDATMGYARDLDTGDGTVLGRIGAAWKLRF